ncbi:hypothetical protein [Tunturiibacter lichenicola]|uniref:hypothetical protein n=1 Tax=Tunturiibacter lichenicola TaxID=2051959 RepID=UPI0028C48C81|nr:hypothetical protein [Edaphobacter lichenicola]
MKVLGRMFMQRRIAASNMPALQAHPKMNPGAAYLQALLATLRRRFNLSNLIQMCTFHAGHLPSPPILSLNQSLVSDRLITASIATQSINPLNPP